MMDTQSMISLFDAIVILYGIYCIYSAKKMSETKKPPAFLVNPGELVGARDVAGFCAEIYKPLIIFGVIAIAYGIFNIASEYIHIHYMISLASILVFLGLCIWFVRLLRVLKNKYF